MRIRKLTVALAVVMATLLAGPAAALAGNGHGKGNGNGHGVKSTAVAATCTVDGNLVTGHDLPLMTLLNFMVEDESGTWGWVLGQTSTGTWTVRVPERTGPTTYMFVSKTWGKDGSKYKVYASCSAS